MSSFYALVGSWHFRPSPRGYSVFQYNPQTAELQLVQRAFDEISVGAQVLNEQNSIAYVCDERGSRRGEVGGGGYVLAIHIDPATGKLTLINEKPSLSPEPSYVLLDKSCRYVVVVHHCDGGCATKIQQDETGAYYSSVQFDDAAVVLFPLNSDGSLGDPCDVSVVPGGPSQQAKLHCIVADPSGELFLICDKGMDKVYAFTIDRQAGKLVRLASTDVPQGYSPRYGAFHPTLPVFYFNNEKTSMVCAMHYDVKTGALHPLAQASLQAEHQKSMRVEASDLAVHSQGKCLYVSDRGGNQLAVFALSETGALSLVQNIGCGGENPRGICLSPDGRFLLVANSDTDNVLAFAIQADGSLQGPVAGVHTACPANIRILTV